LAKGVPVVTIELPNAGVTPTQDEMQRMWKDLLTWAGEHLAPRQLASGQGRP